jgi:hypothetical protein
MAMIGYLIVCEDVYGEGDIVIKKPYSAISPYSIPGNFSFVISFSLIDLKENVSYKLNLEIIDPEGTIMLGQNIEFDVSPQAESFTSGVLNIKFNNVVFKKKGLHTFKITIDNGHSNQVIIPVTPSGQ